MFCFVHILTNIWLLITSSCYPKKKKKNLRTVMFIIKRNLLREYHVGSSPSLYYCNIGSIWLCGVKGNL